MSKNQTLKLFGLNKEEIENQIKNLDLSGVSTYVKEKYQDAFLFVESKGNDEIFAIELAKIVNNFKNYIYADRDISLYERLFEVLQVRNKTISLMEQATGGIITTNLMAFDNAEKHIKVSYTLTSVKSVIDHFDINPYKFTTNNGVSEEIAFDIASNIRSRIVSDVYVVCLSTLIDGNELYYDGEDYAVVAIGTQNGVKLFKVKKDAKKRDFMNQIAKTACFKLINILK